MGRSRAAAEPPPPSSRRRSAVAEPPLLSCRPAATAEQLPLSRRSCASVPASAPRPSPPVLTTAVMATPSVLTFDAEGRAVDFEVWVDDLQLFLQCDRADGLSLFDLTLGASPAPPATADSTVRSQWATRDAAARLAVRRHLPTTERAHFSQYRSAQTLYDAVVARNSSPATAALSRLFLPYLRSELRLPLAGDAAQAGAGGAGVPVGLAAAVEVVVVEAVEGAGVVVGVVAGVEASVAAVEAEEAEVAEAVAEVAEAAVALVADLRRGVVPVVVSARSSSAVVRPLPPSSFVSGTLVVREVGLLVPAPTFYVLATALVSSAGACTPLSAVSAA
ncbi:unnamed protein product [Closterium sp. NIES-54]